MATTVDKVGKDELPRKAPLTGVIDQSGGGGDGEDTKSRFGESRYGYLI